MGGAHQTVELEEAMLKMKSTVVAMGTLLALVSGVAMSADPETQKQIDVSRT